MPFCTRQVLQGFHTCGKWWIWYNPGSVATLLHLWLVALVTYFPPKNKYFSIADSLL